jgi:hypothetical protein
MLAIILLEQILRVRIARRTPVVGERTPPGAVGTRVLLPLVAGLVVWSLRGRRASA